MRVFLDESAYAPCRAHSTDAGIDLRSTYYSRTIPAHGSCVFDTGVHVELPKNCAGLIVSKSGLNIYHNITSEGLIDEGYTGSIMVKLYNHGDEDYEVKAGDKISQLVIIPVVYTSVEIVGSFEDTVRGNDGFGSSGR